MTEIKDFSKEFYYLENDKVVFTEEYHKNRGHCCGNGCRHCPYWPKYQKGNKNLKRVEIAKQSS